MKTLTGKKIAVLAANGFEQEDMACLQRAFMAAGVMPATISPEQGVLTSWHGVAWGHCFTIDAKIGETLSVDYDVLVIPGGMRHIPRLLASLHTERIISGFVEGEKPIVAFGDGAQVLDACKCPAGPNVYRMTEGEDRAAFIARVLGELAGSFADMRRAA